MRAEYATVQHTSEGSLHLDHVHNVRFQPRAARFHLIVDPRSMCTRTYKRARSVQPRTGGPATTRGQWGRFSRNRRTRAAYSSNAASKSCSACLAFASTVGDTAPASAISHSSEGWSLSIPASLPLCHPLLARQKDAGARGSNQKALARLSFVDLTSERGRQCEERRARGDVPSVAGVAGRVYLQGWHVWKRSAFALG